VHHIGSAYGDKANEEKNCRADRRQPILGRHSIQLDTGLVDRVPKASISA
jgi:hypothetical protein